MNEASEARGRGLLRELLGWGILAALFAFTAAVHHGVGPKKIGWQDRWFTPTSFLIEHDLTYEFFQSFGSALLATMIPALILAAAVFLAARSAFARALAASCLAAVFLFVFYGVFAPQPWEFFGWRGSATLVLTALAVGFSAAAPFLAASWLRLSRPLRVVTYLPFVAFVIVFLRNSTGTDPSLPFAISPWPAVPVFGLEVGSLFVALWLLGTAIGVGAIVRSRGQQGRALRLVGGLAAALAAPVLLLLLGSLLGTLPFSADATTLVAVSLACALAIGVLTLLPDRRAGADPMRRARNLAVGAALIGAPLIAGQAWAYLDYYVTREVLARRITDALDVYLERETLYPDALEELVEAGDLDAIPEPFIGFGFLYDGDFRYQNFGTSFILEFPAPRWVECAYTPPYDDEEEEAESDYVDAEDYVEDPDFAVADALGEAWSCPSRPPELW